MYKDQSHSCFFPLFPSYCRKSEVTLILQQLHLKGKVNLVVSVQALTSSILTFFSCL